ncbi:ubiquinone biosynthesis methyltransferase UbiE [Brachybacterium phenoliresistens]|uniref:Demethylmenaquinone methyltransferase n=1 Tax=Brachybacterium phenoliresistens TaxID=396014 RepID=Z9JQ36_9MICO|nr:demethylmenaquinone methyltransferase [Brachybacterium phenoliresistens]EWS80500.1 ubiquinone biosynthesis methyltransferase UbiE [Brachybacterium phenoliresistens]
MSRADLDKKPYDVAGMFDSIAGRYDVMNNVAALGQVRGWRAAMVESLSLRPGDTVLDLAAGTGTSTAAIEKAGARAVAADFSLGMMTEGRRRQPHLPFVGADAQRLPFADASFDAAVISFGLRNVQDPRRGLAEMARVVRPGGAVVVCEFSTPTNGAFRGVYQRYLLRALPAVASRFATQPDAYDYLAESILDWPAQEELRRWFAETGLVGCQYRNLSGGIVALHRGYVPAEDAATPAQTGAPAPGDAA